MSTPNNANELKITRVYDAPVRAVWEAWTDPAQVAQWWGPRGFTITTHSKGLRPGGHWSYTMHGPDGTNYENKTLYYEVEECARLVYDHGGNDDRPPLFRVTVLFSESDGKTTMDMTMTLPSPEAAAETARFIKKAGGHGTWDRLAEYIDKAQTGRESFFITRSFLAPIDVLFAMWSEPAHFSQWLAPAGFTMDFLSADIRPGGSTVYRMTNGEFTMYGRAEYQLVEKPDRIVYTQQFCDEHGNVSRHPLAPVWPETMRTEVLFTSEGPNETRVTVRWEPCGEVKPEEMELFKQARGGMTQGWTGSFDKLEAKLAESSR